MLSTATFIGHDQNRICWYGCQVMNEQLHIFKFKSLLQLVRLRNVRLFLD
uniref:Uncharacterized protein n=1 Tax=Aegilops tauschii subsp. strangulata TaxID=200361 RepID=A0A453ARM7_AEGTS